MLKVSVVSLERPERVGWMTKQGFSWRTWRRRYFVLKDNLLYYFKTPNDSEATGVITLAQDSFVKKETDRKRFMFAIGTPSRVYFMYPDTEAERVEWINTLQGTIDKLKESEVPKSSLISSRAASVPAKMNAILHSKDVRQILNQAKSEISFLDSDESRVLEFWRIWFDSIPTKKELSPKATIKYQISISGDMEKISWKASGPQHLLIQRMVNFFWNVGAPDTEIDRLNDIGTTINPAVIGSWIDMSVKGGMDGGWFFLHNPLSLSVCTQAADSGPPINRLAQWAGKCGLDSCLTIGRDMGAAPPRQTEFLFEIKGNDYDKLNHALSAYGDFGFPTIPEEALDFLKQICPKTVMMSVVTCATAFVRLGLLASHPQRPIVESLCNLSGGNFEQLNRFESTIESKGPEFVEFQYLSEGFGYGVYREGFDIIFHYMVGEETN